MRVALSKIVKSNYYLLGIKEADTSKYQKKLKKIKYDENEKTGLSTIINNQGDVTRIDNVPSILQSVDENYVLGVTKNQTKIDLKDSIKKVTHYQITDVIDEVDDMYKVEQSLVKRHLMYGIEGAGNLDGLLEDRYVFPKGTSLKSIIKKLKLEDASFIKYDYIYNHQLAYYREHSFKVLKQFMVDNDLMIK